MECALFSVSRDTCLGDATLHVWSPGSQRCQTSSRRGGAGSVWGCGCTCRVLGLFGAHVVLRPCPSPVFRDYGRFSILLQHASRCQPAVFLSALSPYLPVKKLISTARVSHSQFSTHSKRVGRSFYLIFSFFFTGPAFPEFRKKYVKT